MLGKGEIWGYRGMAVPLAGRLNRMHAGCALGDGAGPQDEVLGRFGTCQLNFTSPAPKLSLPPAHLSLSPTPTCSSGSDGDSDVDSELEERVDGVKSWLSKNKGSSKALSDDGSLKGSRWVQGWERMGWAGGQPGRG